MKNIRKIGVLLLFVIVQLSNSLIIAQDFENVFDKILSERYGGENPGVTALVYKDGELLYRKAFGMANLELKVPMKPENIFEIGSMTKQFTATAILMLIERGELSLDDEITEFIPDYPVKGNKITVHHLLNHTSGIRSYTNMKSFMELAREDKKPTEIIDHFKNAPMDFDTGEEWKYNNSGYIILGHIIEVVSGKSYAAFISENIFKPLGMKNSVYGSKTQLITDRASGYMPTENGYRNANYLSMSLPYAAGSLMSNIDDMLLWHKAVHGHTLIKTESQAKAFTNTKLNNGEFTNYGYGWQINEINGVGSIEHGGGIFGYVTQGIYVPEENVYVVLMTNTNGKSPQNSAVKMAAHVIGKPFPEVEDAISVTENELKKWIGTYTFDEAISRTISLDDGKLFSQLEGTDKLALFPVSESRFYFEGRMSYYDFSIENGKKVVVFNARIDTEKGRETD